MSQTPQISLTSLHKPTDKFVHSYKLCYKFQPPKDPKESQSSQVKYTASQHETTSPAKALPTVFSLRSKMASILDQGNVGDCVSNAYALAISTMTLGPKQVNMSRLMNYAVARVITGGTVVDDSGLYVADAATCIAKYGVCQESAWPYNTNNFNILPPLNAFQSSKLFNKFTYTTVSQDLTSLKSCLVNKQVPIIFGFMIYSSFMTNAVAKNGIVPMPDIAKEAVAGGHCTNIVGYDDTKQWFICANSWGISWGDRGYFYMPYAYMTNANLASDFLFMYF